MSYGLRAACLICEVPRGEACRSQRKGFEGQSMVGFHKSRVSPADLVRGWGGGIPAWKARGYGLRSNRKGTCLLCGVTLTKERRDSEHFCTTNCAARFGRLTADHGSRLVERETGAEGAVRGLECVWCFKPRAYCECEEGPTMLVNLRGSA